MQNKESTFRFHPADLVASNASPTEAGGCICAGAPSADTSAAATTRRGNTPRPMRKPAAIRSSAASNRARTGSSTIRSPSFSPDRNSNHRRITRSIKAFQAQPHASRLAGSSSCTDGVHGGNAPTPGRLAGHQAQGSTTILIVPLLPALRTTARPSPRAAWLIAANAGSALAFRVPTHSEGRLRRPFLTRSQRGCEEYSGDAKEER